MCVCEREREREREGGNCEGKFFLSSFITVNVQIGFISFRVSCLYDKYN